MNKIPHIMVVCPNPDDATAFYRATWPLAKLARQGFITYELAQKQEIPKMMRCDIVFLQRPCVDEHINICKSAKLWGKTLWVDYDDNLFKVPDTNPAYPLFSKPAIRDAMEACLKLADFVTVSTKYIADSFKEYNSNIHVLSNGIDLDLLDYRDVDIKSRKKLVSWRGSNTHEDDVGSVAAELIEVSKAHTDWKFIFFGPQFPMLKNLLHKDSYIHVNSAANLIFMENLHKAKSAIHIVPLQFNDFNRSKSNIAWLEATWAGSAVIAPDMDEWKYPGVVRYSTPKQFKEALEALMNDSKLMSDCYKASWDYITSNLTLKSINEDRLELIRLMALKAK